MKPHPRLSARPTQRPLVRDERGAVAVEFLTAFVPILLLFLCIGELTRLSIANLMLQRSAGIATRACAVIKNQPLHCDNNQDDRAGQDPGQDENIRLAALAALKPFPPDQLHLDAASCAVGDDPTAQSGTDRVSVSARFRCTFPLAKEIVCSSVEKTGSPLGGGERTRVLTASALFAHQGARYDCWFSRELRLGIPGLGATDPIEAPEWF